MEHPAPDLSRGLDAPCICCGLTAPGSCAVTATQPRNRAERPCLKAGGALLEHGFLFALARGELAVVEVGVEATLRQQFFVPALLDDAAVVHHQDAVGVTDGREPVRDDEAGATTHQLAHSALDQDL